MSAIDVERSLVTAIVDDDEAAVLTDGSIRKEYFYDEETLDIWNFLLRHYSDTGRVATRRIVKRNYPNFQFANTEGHPVSYFAHEVRDRHKYRVIAIGLQEVVGEMSVDGENAGERILDLVQGLVLKARVEVPDGEVVDFFGDSIEEFKKLLSERKVHGRMRGIPTGFPAINDATGGLQEEQLITLVALPGAGKSSILLSMAMNAAYSGARALFITFEMSAQEQQDRFMSIRNGISLNRIQDGNLTRKQLLQIDTSHRRQSGLAGHLNMVHDRSSVTTLTGLQAKINEYDPHVVFIDGVYLMEDENGEPPNSPRALTNLTRGLKRMCQLNKIPIVVSTQALNQKLSNGKVTMHSAGYTSSFSQDSDVVFVGNAVPEAPGVICFRADKVRSGPNAEEYLRFDWDDGKITILSEAEVASKAAVSEEDREGMDDRLSQHQRSRKSMH